MNKKIVFLFVFIPIFVVLLTVILLLTGNKKLSDSTRNDFTSVKVEGLYPNNPDLTLEENEQTKCNFGSSIESSYLELLSYNETEAVDIAKTLGFNSEYSKFTDPINGDGLIFNNQKGHLKISFSPGKFSFSNKERPSFSQIIPTENLQQKVYDFVKSIPAINNLKINSAEYYTFNPEMPGGSYIKTDKDNAKLVRFYLSPVGFDQKILSVSDFKPLSYVDIYSDGIISEIFFYNHKLSENKTIISLKNCDDDIKNTIEQSEIIDVKKAGYLIYEPPSLKEVAINNVDLIFIFDPSLKNQNIPLVPYFLLTGSSFSGTKEEITTTLVLHAVKENTN